MDSACAQWGRSRATRAAALLLLATLAFATLATACAPRLVVPPRSPGPPRAARAPQLAAPARAHEPLVTAVTTVGMTVADLGRSVDFFTRVLDFTLVSTTEVTGTDVERLQGVVGARVRVARLRLGDETIELGEYRVPRGRPIPPGGRSNDRSFQHVAIVTSDMARAHERLRRHRVEPVSAGPQRLPDWNPKAGGIEAFYFKDPDGHVLEAIHFPKGKGDARWQCRSAYAAPRDRRDAARAARGASPGAGGHRRRSREGPGRSRPASACPLFQGIDHTAIVVADTERSLAFYRDALGLGIAGTSENWGPEQARLNGVPGAHLRITSLRAAHGPGVELLEYLAPRDGRPLPGDLAAHDVAHWETTVATADLAGAATRLRAAGTPFVAPPTVSFPDAPLGFSAATMVRDPDGHALRVITH